jgi:hypothetical protein
MAGESRTFAGAGADLDAGKRGAEQAVKGRSRCFSPIISSVDSSRTTARA